MVAYVVEALDDVLLDVAGPEGRLAHHDLMSPYVWLEGESRVRMLVRVVPNPLGPTDPTGVIWAGDSTDGLNFTMRKEPSIVPGPEPIDVGGCEDPTMVCSDGGYLIFYTGVDAARSQGSMLVASGPHLNQLTKQKVMLEAPKGEGNIKEATLAKGSDGQYRLFYEYAKDNASRVGMATGPGLEGPWTTAADPFTIREGAWDNWHLSTGPMLEVAGHNPVMFYNGATDDARWRIGWIEFDPAYTQVTARGVEPLLIPPPAKDRSSTDIAFVASTVVKDGAIWIYYSLEDKVLRRATVRRYD